MSSNKNSIKTDEGKTEDWIEIYNSGNDAVDLLGYSLSDDLENWEFPSIIIEPLQFLIIFASGDSIHEGSEIHTNFKLKSAGEQLLLFSPTGNVIDSIPAVDLESDKTFGRIVDGGEELVYLSYPTPGESNNEVSVEREIVFSHGSGFYESDFELILNSEDSIFYTTNGSLPTIHSNVFESNIQMDSDELKNSISLIPTVNLTFDPNDPTSSEFGFQEPIENVKKGIVIRAQTFKSGEPTSEVYSNTYFLNKNPHEFSVVSLITDSSSLFNYDTGIYVPGVYYDENNPFWTGNYYLKGDVSERNGFVEFFTPSDGLVFSENIGYRISGQNSRTWPQKSLRLYFRDEYGASNIKYPFFESRDYKKFKRLTLRSSMTYWWGRNTLFGDDFVHMFVTGNEFDIENQHSSPSVLYINGEYWGVQNLRERQDKHYFESLYDVDEDSLDYIAGNLSVDEGSSEDFTELYDFIVSKDLTIEENYDYIKSKMDISNYVDYFIIETFFGNYDWPWNNMKIWKTKKPGSKWRWVLYDLDASMSVYKNDPFQYLFDSDNNQALMFTKLLTNEDFKFEFVSTYATYIQSKFAYDNVIDYLESFESMYSSEVSRHIDRWGNPSSVEVWYSSVDYLKDYFKYRPCSIAADLVKHFGVLDTSLDNCVVGEVGSKSIFIQIFPNPVVDVLSIEVVDSVFENSDVKIFNSTGQTVYTKKIVGKSTEINCKGFTKGIHFIQFSSEGNSMIQKIVVN